MPDPTILDNQIVHDGVTWVPGIGDRPAGLVFLAERPNQAVVRRRAAFAGNEEQIIVGEARKAGLLDMGLGVHKTYAVKYTAKGGKNTTSGDIKRCAQLLFNELKALKPEYVVCIGLHALKAVMGKAAKLSDYQGALVECVLVDPSYVKPKKVKVSSSKSLKVTASEEVEVTTTRIEEQVTVPDTIRFKVFTIMGLGMLKSAPWRIPMCSRLMQYLAYYIRNNGQPLEKEPQRAVLDTDAAAQDVIRTLMQIPQRLFALDMEWNGETWMHSDRKIVTIQLGLDRDTAIIFELHKPDGTANFNEVTMLALKGLLEDPNTAVFGHNVASDSQWLMSYGIDVRGRIVFDTMLAESLLNSQGPFGLEEAVLKYTWIGRYDFALAMWKQSVDDEEYAHGYLKVPRDILFPYGAWDVCALFPIMYLQLPLLEKYGFMKPRGNEVSLWVSELQTANNILELEQNGLLVDAPLLDDVQNRYTTRLGELEAALKVMLNRVGLQDFNFRSTAAVSNLLFNVLKLAPVKTTKGKDWKKAVSNQPAEEQALYKPATDKTTLEILEGSHPIIKPLSNTQRLETLVKTFLRDNEDSDCGTRGGGIKSKIWPDGRLHPHFTMLTKTGRFNCSRPNIQNWPKRADKFLIDIFGSKEAIPAPMRHIIIPAPGNVLIEADFTQAELFVLAYASGDANMIRNLETPGLDLHTTTTVNSFKMKVIYGPTGQPIIEEDVLALAARDFKAFEALQNDFIYVDSKGKQYPYSVFREGPRVSGKAISFGVPYSRGALDIARQIKAETGSERPLAEIEAEVEIMIEAWKTETYPTAWAYLCNCGDAVLDPGFLQNSWGRYRFFTFSEDREIVDAQKREAQNFPYWIGESKRGEFRESQTPRSCAGNPEPSLTRKRLEGAETRRTVLHGTLMCPRAPRPLHGHDIVRPGTRVNKYQKRRIKSPRDNIMIQSTVADTVMIAMQRLVEYRERTGLKYKLVNQIHDAVMLEAPETEIEQTIQAFKETMGTIAIPMGARTLTLGVDITVLDRWGVKRKKKG